MSLRVSATEVKLKNVFGSAIRANQLVNRTDVQYIEAAEGARHRYGKLIRAVKHAGRLAVAKGLHAFILGDLYEDNAPIGIGTVIRLNTDRNPFGEGVFTMHDVNYWIYDGAGDDLHDQAAQKMMFKAKSIASDETKKRIPKQTRQLGGTIPHGFIYTENPAEPEVGQGLSQMFDRVGVVSPLDRTYYIGEDPYDVCMQGIAVQLHYRHVDIPLTQ